MNDDQMKDVLEIIARRGIPETTNLWPHISARIEGKSPTMTLRTRPLRVLLLVFLILLVLSGTAYALGRILGYIPGIGMVEQSTSLLTIEGPALQESDGVRVTIVNAVASPSSTSVRFQVEWLTPPPTTGNFDTSCQGTPSLSLPDGTQLDFLQTVDKFTVGEPGSNAGYGYVMQFDSIPAGQNDVTFNYPCLVPIVPGPLPRDWQIPLHLVPAPEEMALPVVTVPPTQAVIVKETALTPSSPTLTAADPTHRIAMSVDSFVPMEDGYLLIGSMSWSVEEYPAYGVKPIAFIGYINVLDANGQSLPWQEVFENVKPQNDEYQSYWAIKILTKTFTPPLSITMNAVDVQTQPVVFQFDPGAAAQAGQSWGINQDLQIANIPVHVSKVNLTLNDGNLNFQLDVQVDPNRIGDLHVSTALDQCMGGGGGYPTEHLSTLQIFVPLCRPNLPPGAVEMQVTGAVLWGEWQVNWQP